MHHWSQCLHKYATYSHGNLGGYIRCFPWLVCCPSSTDNVALGLDSSNHAQTSMSVRGDSVWGIGVVIYIREMTLVLCSVYILQKGYWEIWNNLGKYMKGPIRFKDKIGNRCVGFTKFTFSSWHWFHILIILSDYPTHSCQGLAFGF